MMSKKLLAVLLVIVMCVPSASVAYRAFDGDDSTSIGMTDVTDNGNENVVKTTVNQPVSTQSFGVLSDEPQGEFVEGAVLIKDDSFDESKLNGIEYDNCSPLFPNSVWYRIELSDGVDTKETVKALNDSGLFQKVDYDYVMGADGEIESIDVSSNPNASEQTYLDTMCIRDGWGYLANNSVSPGGNPSVVVAVIDTGVDYNHIDLRNNIWVNTAEIPDNGIDDDGNGYVDDYRGWNFVANTNDPMDDNGHGTHVAGIVAAENNTVGTVGVAWNCKVMVLKAGNSSGYFTNSSIAAAVQYAYMNGASVINMSFGGTSISMAVEDALENAYVQCVLVAAAGNNGYCNQPGCPHHIPFVEVVYPAALTYVVGVMSCNAYGAVSSFSNYDHNPYNSIEYDVFACGESVVSTWINNRVAKMSGTSMAAPVISGIAALLRAQNPDRDVYSNKYIQSQITNTGTILPMGPYAFANAHDALTKVPSPYVKMYDYYCFDDSNYSDMNNADRIIDAGERIHLAIELRNRGGYATNVIATIDAYRNGDSSITDPYVNIVENTIQLSDIGTYSIRDCGKTFDENGNMVGVTKYFDIVISPDCPNDYAVNINLHVTYENGWDQSDDTLYHEDGIIQFIVMNGFKLPSLIMEDTVYSKEKKYLLSNDLTIPSGVTITFEPGSEIEFTMDEDNDYYPSIRLFGNLILQGTEDDRIQIKTSDMFAKNGYITLFDGRDTNEDFAGHLIITYADINNVVIHAADGSWSLANDAATMELDHCFYNLDVVYNYNPDGRALQISSFTNSIFIGAHGTQAQFKEIIDSVIDIEEGNFISWDFVKKVENTLIVGNGPLSANYSRVCMISDGLFVNNVVFMNTNNSNEMAVPLVVNAHPEFGNVAKMGAYNQMITEYKSNGEPIINFTSLENLDCDSLWPFIKNVTIYDVNGDKVTTLDKQQYSVIVEFSRNVDVDVPFYLYYGSVEPFSECRVLGEYISNTKWEGILDLRKTMENGLQFFRTKGGCSETDQFMTILSTRGYFEFDVDTSSSLSMNIWSEVSGDEVTISWYQDDYDTLMGYNVYRSSEKDGNFVRLNNNIIPAGVNSYTDCDAEPGISYWYTYTVVMSDFSESKPAGKIIATPLDTISPSIYHTPLNQGYIDNNLVISCTANDNIGVKSAFLYYRSTGSNEWKIIQMLRQNDKYSGTIYGNELSLDGLEYYIEVFDGVNIVSKGTSAEPYYVVIKDASTISRRGDVDGDGTITTRDALMIMKSINGDIILTDDQFIRADLNEDGVLSSSEALRILQYINGKVTTLTM